MSIRQFETAQVKAPFLGKPHYPISGLDQLGLNLTSERIFDLLLPGLNNVTGRIRYYSFYCWFFDWYASTIRITSKKSQNKYLRRAEFLLALIAAHKTQGGIPGITKAQSIYESSGETIDLSLGTQEGSSSDGSYWKNPNGVLGQYYISSIKQMGILVDQGDVEGLYVRTDFQHQSKVSGKQLAEAFALNVDGTSHAFAKAIQNNAITKTQLESLSEDFNMLTFPKKSNEQELLWNLFSGVDRPKEREETYFRRETIKLLLDNVSTYDIDDKYDQLKVPLDIYHNGWSADYLMTEKLWYFFMMEQFWSVSSTGCLDAFLKILDKKSNNNWIEEIELVDHIISKVLDLFGTEGVNVESDLFFEIPFMEQSIEELVYLSKTETDPYIKISFSLCAIQKLFLENRTSKDELLEISNRYKIHTASSFLISYVDFQSKQDLTIKEFIGYFLTRNVINRHHFVALRKLNATQNSAKFYREDGMIRLVDHFIYDYSSPRIHTLVDFMRDLGVIETDSTALTQKGKEHLKILAQ